MIGRIKIALDLGAGTSEGSAGEYDCAAGSSEVFGEGLASALASIFVEAWSDGAAWRSQARGQELAGAPRQGLRDAEVDSCLRRTRRQRQMLMQARRVGGGCVMVSSGKAGTRVE